jgi:hypothetical protein
VAVHLGVTEQMTYNGYYRLLASPPLAVFETLRRSEHVLIGRAASVRMRA